jgi:NAD-dependent DNA ligase
MSQTDYDQELEARCESLESELHELSTQVEFLRTMVIITRRTFCFTGKLQSMTRERASKIVESNGGYISTSVTSNTDYLVTNTPNSNTTKNRQAQKHKTQIITEKQFLFLFGLEEYL